MAKKETVYNSYSHPNEVEAERNFRTRRSGRDRFDPMATKLGEIIPKEKRDRAFRIARKNAERRGK